jgi:probable F420-dependent oxidoreductase
VKIGPVVVLVPDPGQILRYVQIRNTALAAEEAGFDSVWLYDHLLYRNEGEPTTGIWECWTTLSALAEATQRVELGSLVACSQFRNPAILAKMAATLDEVSGGRLIFGIGAGWNQPEFDAFGIPFDHRVDRLKEALQVIVPLVREGKVDFQGRYYTARNCEISPRGPRPNGPPILIGGWGPRVLRLAARYADFWNAGYYTWPESFAEQRGAFEKARDEVGRDPATIGVTTVLKVGWPDLGELPSFFGNECLTGSSEEIAAAFRAYDDSGVSHVMCHYAPDGPEALGRLGEAMRVYRAG